MDRSSLAGQVVDLARAKVLAKNHFLSAAVGRLELEAAVLGERFVTDGYKLYFDPERVLEGFREERLPPEHDLLHSVVHCLFLHPYIGPTVNRRFWDLACDIVAERVAAELIGPRQDARGARSAAAIGRIERDAGRRVGAEKLYALFCDGEWEGMLSEWEALFHSDDHTAWYAFGGSDDEGDGASGDSSGESGSFKIAESGENGESESDGSSGSGAADSRSGECEENTSDPASDGSCRSCGSDSSPSEGSSDEDASEKRFDDSSGYGNNPGESVEVEVLSREGLRMRRLQQPSLEQQMDQWRQVATSLSLSLQAASSRQLHDASGFAEDLEKVSSKREDYADFLRLFATFGEVMRISDDEFDSIFYTYGMKLYGNMPLIEPLEYREEKRIREFVIVIDSSGSVSGDIAKRFAEATFGILKSTESFFDRIHLRILQCDAQVQSDDRIETLEELAAWGNKLKVFGRGGTDFRPAFSYVDSLVENGEFANLGGLVYFTDGQGTYPDWMPSYRTAFVFYGEGEGRKEAPPWAFQMVLDPGSMKDGAVENVQGVVR